MSPDHEAQLTAISAIASPRSERPRRDDRIYIEIGDISIDSKSVTLKDKPPVPGAQLAHSGDVLVSTVRPGRGAVALAPLRAAVSSALAVLFGETAADTRFIFHIVCRPEFAAHLDKLASGSTYPTCSSRDVLEFMTVIPHPAERAKIVLILDTVDQAIRSTEALIVKLTLLRQAYSLTY
jgi:restriction endonuclease S subunit